MKLLFSLAALAVLAVSIPARAQVPASIEQAEARFAQAERHAADREWALALNAFEDVHRYLEGANHPRRALVLYDIALCLRELGRESDALDHYERFLEQAPPDAT